MHRKRVKIENFRKHLIEDERGLSLVELLAVVVILAIIAGIGFVGIGRIIQNAREDAAVATVKRVYEAAKLYVSTSNKHLGAYKGWLDNKDKNDYINEYDFTVKTLMDEGVFDGVPVKEESGYWVEKPAESGIVDPRYISFILWPDKGLTMSWQRGCFRAGKKKSLQKLFLDESTIINLTKEQLFGG
ncbi:type II secretion system protein [Enterococcus faecalis]